MAGIVDIHITCGLMETEAFENQQRILSSGGKPAFKKINKDDLRVGLEVYAKGQLMRVWQHPGIRTGLSEK